MRRQLKRGLLLLLWVCGMMPDSRGSICQPRQFADSAASDTLCYQQDIFDVLTRKKIKAPEIPTRKVRAIILPFIAYSPSTGFQFGTGSSLSWTFGKDPVTRLSAGSVQLVWTTERQFISYLRANMFLDRNLMFLQTDWRLYLFRLPTYGLGTGPANNIPAIPEVPVTPENEQAYSGGKFYMKYDWIKFHNVLFRAVATHFYAGIGYHLDYYYDISDDALSLDSSVVTVTPHYAYCMLHGFNPTKYTASGLSLNFLYDSRDNIINAYKGYYINVNYRYNLQELGSNQNSSTLWTEFRTYVGLSSRMPRHVLAFWIYGSYRISGEIPYLNLMSTGFDQMNSSGRGYVQGRWRGESLMYGEMEYRFPISRCTGIVGGVLFVNATTASNHDMNIPLFAYLKPGAGFGIRIMVGKYDRTNILIDFGLGEFSHGMYIQAQEIF